MTLLTKSPEPPYRSIHLFNVDLSVYLSTHTYPSLRLPTCLPVCASICLRIYLSVCLSVYPFTCVGTHLSTYLSVSEPYILKSELQISNSKHQMPRSELQIPMQGIQWSEGAMKEVGTRDPKRHISISILWGYPCLIGLHYKGVYMEHPYPYFSFCAFWCPGVRV